jgi:hypothetical protein
MRTPSIPQYLARRFCLLSFCLSRLPFGVQGVAVQQLVQTVSQ